MNLLLKILQSLVPLALAFSPPEPPTLVEVHNEIDHLEGLSPEHPEVFELSCEQGDGVSCAFLASAVKRGLVPSHTNYSLFVDKIAISHLILACKQEDAYACLGLAICYKNGFQIPSSIPLAIHYAKRACDLGLGRGCFKVGNLLSDQPATALPFYQKACHLKNTAGCLKLAYSFENGLGTHQDKEKASRIYSDLCRKRVSVACTFSNLLSD